MSQRFARKRILVTGGSSGIGKTIAIMFAENGARVACVASSDLKKAQAAIAEAGAVSGELVPFAANVGVWDQAARLVDEVEEAFGGIDVLVTAAGVFYPTASGEQTREATERMIATNLIGTIATINAVVPGMKKNKGGKIIALSSVAGLVGMGGYSAYCATKAGVIGMVKALAIELAPHGININAIAPGNTETPMNEDIRTKPELRHVFERNKARTPSRRVYSKAEDMARAALYLASEDSIAMYGSTMVLDEGFIAGV